jgi:para-aminobenzoate synthetase component 1
MKPLVEEISYVDPVSLFAKVKDEVGAIFLDSALTTVDWGRYSYIAFDPWKTLRSTRDNPISFDRLQRELASCSLGSIPDLPPFQGGVAGYFSYELGTKFEHIKRAPVDDLHVPDFMVGFYDVVLAFDHKRRQAWIFSSGFPSEDLARAQERLTCVKNRLFNDNIHPWEVPFQGGNLYSPFDSHSYPPLVQKVIDYIYAGDIYQANLTRRYQTHFTGDPFNLYRRLRLNNPAPFAAYIKDEQHVVASASPELFLKVINGQVETKPIKGTARRDLNNPVHDRQLAVDLMNSEKDRAENLMIVDLMRNDLSRVCRPGSVKVPKLWDVETYATVHHLVSTVVGQLEGDKTAIDLLKATFPGGSITGAPKIRAMEIIAELEPTCRGVYCGSIGFIGFDGSMDLNIAIRTFVLTNDILTFQVGGGIVADSDPLAEYEETRTKRKQ